MLDIVKPCWLIATGTRHRVEVLRSPLVETDSDIYQPVRRHITDNGLVLAAQRTFPDSDWMFGKVEMSVYTLPGDRNNAYGLLG